MMTTSDAPQLPMTQPEPQEEHRWLQKLIGEWTSEAEMLMGPFLVMLMGVSQVAVRPMPVATSSTPKERSRSARWSRAATP